MKHNPTVLLALGFGLFLAATPALGHHSFAAEFDRDERVTLEGIVTKVEWQNPHVYFYVDVMGENGIVSNWAFEMGAPSVLTRTQGWTRSTLRIGDEVVVEASRAKDGSNLGNARNVTMASGQRLGAASSEGVAR